jgi:hypothetical protein
LRDDHRLRVFENKVLRRISGPKKDEVMGGWRKMHNEELHDLCSPRIIRMIKKEEMDRPCSMHGERRKCVGYGMKSQRERDHLEDQDMGGWIDIKMDFG